MKDALLREQKDRVLRPLVEQFLGNVSPNLLSYIAVVPGILAAVAVVSEYYWLGLFLWLLNRLMDGIDGLAARVQDTKSDLGGYLDLLLDFVVYLAVPIAFVLVAPSTALLWALAFLLGSYQINTLSWTLLSSIIEKRQQSESGRLTSIEMPPGLIEGAETVLIYSLFFILPQYAFWLFLLMGILVFFTAGQRIVWAYRNI
jgi:phosphatidylglycerophosphate synthase